MKFRIVPLLTVMLLALVLAAVVACGDDDEDAAPTSAAAAATDVPVATSDIQRGGKLIIGTPQQITTLDGHVVGPLNNRNAWDAILAPYVKYKPDGLVGPHMLKSWDISSDLTNYTFTVQEGVKFHTGRAMEAEDLRFSTQRAIDLESSWSQGLFGITSIEATGPLTLKMTNDKASSVFPDQFERHYLVAKDNVSDGAGGTAGAEDNFTLPIGTGPFEFVEFIPGEKVTATRFGDYWKMGEDGEALPYLDEVEIRTITDSTALIAAIKTGAVHVYWQLPAKLAPTLDGDPNARAVPTVFSTQHLYMTFEHQRTTGDNVFADIRARRALLLALDKDELAAVGFGDSGLPLWTNQATPANLPFGPSGFPEIRQDKAESKRLFEEVGVKEINFVGWDTPWMQPVLSSVQQQLSEVGVEAILHINLIPDWTCALGRGDCGPDWKFDNQVSFNGAANPPEPSLHIAQRWLCPGVDSMGKWCNPKMDELALAATQTTDNDERARLYKEWNQIFVDQVASVSWVQLQDWHGEHNSVNGLEDLYLVLWYESVWLTQ
jgi:ABC-type transport system substrate-binding protein